MVRCSRRSTRGCRHAVSWPWSVQCTVRGNRRDNRCGVDRVRRTARSPPHSPWWAADGIPRRADALRVRAGSASQGRPVCRLEGAALRKVHSITSLARSWIHTPSGRGLQSFRGSSSVDRSPPQRGAPVFSQIFNSSKLSPSRPRPNYSFSSSLAKGDWSRANISSRPAVEGVTEAAAVLPPCNSRAQYVVVHAERSSAGPFEPPACRYI
jgi:hypothetical protein